MEDSIRSLPADAIDLIRRALFQHYLHSREFAKATVVATSNASFCRRVYYQVVSKNLPYPMIRDANVIVARGVSRSFRIWEQLRQGAPEVTGDITRFSPILWVRGYGLVMEM